MRRRILLVDDEVAILLTLKAVLEINGFDVETAASAREAHHLLMTREYNMIVTDMRMETDRAGADVIKLARSAPSKPAIAILTAFPVAEEDWRDLGADKMLVKPMNTHVLLQQIELLLIAHEENKRLASQPGAVSAGSLKKKVVKKAIAKKASKKLANITVRSKKTVKPKTAKKKNKNTKQTKR